MPSRVIFLAIAVLLAVTVSVCISAEPQRRVEVHLYGGDLRQGAPLASWYRSIGITDVWLYPVKGSFPQDQDPKSQQSPRDLDASGTLGNYRENHIRYWWFERPVPDFFYLKSKGSDFPRTNLWDSSVESDVLWSNVCRNIKSIYGEVRKAGFHGLVYDTESYYSFQGDEKGETKPWVWGGHDDQYGFDGNYYRRGLQVGKAINDIWPDAKVVMVYAHGYTGEIWWYRGIKDGGTDLYLGAEHTYGAGPSEFGDAPYQSWWLGKKTKEVCDWKRMQFPYITDNQHVMAGLFPIDFGTKKPNYRAKYFCEQLDSAANADSNGPIAVWLWPQGEFSPASWQRVNFASGESSKDYLDVLRNYSQAFQEDSKTN